MMGLQPQRLRLVQLRQLCAFRRKEPDNYIDSALIDFDVQKLSASEVYEIGMRLSSLQLTPGQTVERELITLP